MLTHPTTGGPLPACRGWVGVMAVAVKWLDLFGLELVVGAGLGVLWGVGLATVYRWNLKRKNERRQLVRAGATGRATAAGCCGCTGRCLLGMPEGARRA